MPDGIVDLIQVDLGIFKFSRLKRGVLNDSEMTRAQIDSLAKLLTESKPEIDRLLQLYEPEPHIMEVMGVSIEDTAYHSIKIIPVIDERTKLPVNWTYKIVCLTKDKDGNPGMAFGDRTYTRDELK